MERYQFERRIKESTRVTVWAAVAKGTGELVTVKTLTEAISTEWNTVRNVREVAALCTLSHPNIIKLKEVVRDGSHTVHLVLEWCASDLLRELSHRSAPFRDDEVRLVLFQLLNAVAYIHRHGFIHRNVNPETIHCSGLEFIKLADFDQARSADSGPMTHYRGTRWYRAPEQLLQRQCYTAAVDIWSAGAVMAELFLLRPLFAGDGSDADQLFKICSVFGTPHDGLLDDAGAESNVLVATASKIPHMSPVPLSSIIPNASADALDLMTGMLRFNPTDRITAEVALQHAYFTTQQK